MKYVMLMCDPEETTPSMAELEADPRNTAFAQAIARLGTSLAGERLRPSVDATTVRVRGGETLVSDGPFAETKDVVGGVVILECANLDDAIAIAAEHPWAHRGCVEIRPVWE